MRYNLNKIVFSCAKKETKRNLTVIECLSKVGGKSFTVRNPLMSMSGAWASLWRRRSVFCDEKSPGKRETSWLRENRQWKGGVVIRGWVTEGQHEVGAGKWDNGPCSTELVNPTQTLLVKPSVGLNSVEYVTISAIQWENVPYGFYPFIASQN